MTRQEAIDRVLEFNSPEREYKEIQSLIEEHASQGENFIYLRPGRNLKVLNRLKKDGFKIFHRTPKKNYIEEPDIILAWITDGIDENGNII